MRRKKLKSSDFSSRDCDLSTQTGWISSGQMLAEYQWLIWCVLGRKKSSAIVIIFFSTSHCLAIPNYENISAIAVEIRADKCSFLRTVSSFIVVVALEQLLTCHQCF